MDTEQRIASFELNPVELLHAKLADHENGTGEPAPTSMAVEMVAELLEDGAITERDATLLVGGIDT